MPNYLAEKNPRRLRERRAALSFMSGSIQLLPRFKVALHRENVARRHLRRGLRGAVIIKKMFYCHRSKKHLSNQNVKLKSLFSIRSLKRNPRFQPKMDSQGFRNLGVSTEKRCTVKKKHGHPEFPYSFHGLPLRFSIQLLMLWLLVFLGVFLQPS